MFSIHDRKTESFGPPYCAATPGEAERNFRTACSNPESDLHRYPEDFTLYQVGFFHNESGQLEALVTPSFVCAAKVDSTVAAVRELRHAS